MKKPCLSMEKTADSVCHLETAWSALTFQLVNRIADTKIKRRHPICGAQPNLCRQKTERMTALIKPEITVVGQCNPSLSPSPRKAHALMRFRSWRNGRSTAKYKAVPQAHTTAASVSIAPKDVGRIEYWENMPAA